MAATIAMLAGCFVAVTTAGAVGAGLIGSVAAAQQPSQSGTSSGYPVEFQAAIGSLEHATETAAGSPSLAPTDRPASQTEVEAGEPDSGPAQSVGTVTPEEVSTGPALEWTEIDPGFADLYAFESLDSGRVLARAWYVGDELSLGGERAVYTDNGTDWTELPLPEGIVVRDIDNAGERWVAYGWTHGSDDYLELMDQVFLSDDQGATWTELTLDIPAGPTPASSQCVRFLVVDSASISDDGIVLDIWGYQVSDDPSEKCPEVASMRLLWSDGSTVEQASEPETSLADITVFDAYVVDNGFVVTAVDDVLSVQHATSGEPAATTATFEGLFPTWNLAAGSAGVAMTAFPSLDGQLEASSIGGLPMWRDFDRVSEPTDVPLWIGWSADGTDWGWQSLPEAFGINEGEPWAQLAVGRDFVIARVETIISPTPEELAAWQAQSCSGSPCSPDACSYVESLYGEVPPLRWFIARVP